VRLADLYEAFLFDLDGVLYRGHDPVGGAVAAVERLRQAGKRLAFLTNNSSRTPGQVADKLAGMGFRVGADEVVTSAEATARLVGRLANEDGRPATAFVIGEEGIRAALDREGIEVRDGHPEEADFVVIGWDRGADYDALRMASVLVRRGALLVATNADATYPAPGGELWPGAGALVAAVETASGARATVVGKPRRALFDLGLESVGTGSALVVGDRLETDVAGAVAAGLDAALVLTGAAGPGDLLDAAALPVAVLADVGGLTDDRPMARVRPAAGDDAEAVRGLVEVAELDPGEVDSTDATVVAAAPDGELLATASADVSGRDGYLRSLAVAPAARGGSLGTLVTAAAAYWARGAGARTLYLLTETAEGFFRRLGFEPVERGSLPGWVTDRSRACAETAVAMRREVAPIAG
jgi:glycerol 3-phosphatase-2